MLEIGVFGGFEIICMCVLKMGNDELQRAWRQKDKS